MLLNTINKERLFQLYSKFYHLTSGRDLNFILGNKIPDEENEEITAQLKAVIEEIESIERQAQEEAMNRQEYLEWYFGLSANEMIEVLFKNNFSPFDDKEPTEHDIEQMYHKEKCDGFVVQQFN